MHIKSLSNVTPFFRILRDGVAQQLADFRTTLLWIVPCIILYTLLILLISIGSFFTAENSHYHILMLQLYRQIHLLFSYLLTIALSFTISIRWKQPRPPFILLSVFYLGLFQIFVPQHPQGMALQYFIAILTPFYAIPTITLLQNFRLLNTFRLNQNHSSPVFAEIVHLIFPAFLTMLLVLAVNNSILNLWDYITPPPVTAADLKKAPYLYGCLISLISSISHFLGLHSFYTLSFVNDALFQAATENAKNYLQHNENFTTLNHTSIGIFSRLGGVGSTLSLIIAILLCCKEKSLRVIALISLLPGLFNMNEPLIFGVPVILNPILLIPFLLTPLVNICMALLLTHLGWVHPTVVSVPYISPLFLNAYIATDGDWHAILLQILNICIGTLIYLPFIIRLSHMYRTKPIYFSEFDTYYLRKKEEAHILTEDFVTRLSHRQKENDKLEKKLVQLSVADFYLEYQPQISLSSGKIIGAEALIRIKDSQNNACEPSTFLPWLEQADMMTDVDLWVFNQAVKDAGVMKKQGIDIRIRINISVNTLRDQTYTNKIFQLLESSGMAHTFDVEITEKSLLQNEQMIKSVFDRFHAMGVKIHLDDFGTGYSSLSYLPKFNIDELKIDRSFLLGVNSPKGKSLFLSLFDIARSQKLDVTVEGVETREQLLLIPKQKGVYVQGWLYSTSLTLSDFIQYVRSFDPELFRIK